MARREATVGAIVGACEPDVALVVATVKTCSRRSKADYEREVYR
jgi:hypothetical protein